MTTIFPPLTQIGVCSKSFGFKGAIKINLNVTLKKNKLIPSFVWIQQYGRPVPYAIQEWKLLNDNELSIKLEDITDENQTISLKNKAIYIENDIAANYFDEIPLQQDVIDYTVLEPNGNKIGKVLAIQEIQGGHPNLILLNAEDKEIIIPFVENIIKEISDKDKTIEVDLPQGLLDLYI